MGQGGLSMWPLVVQWTVAVIGLGVQVYCIHRAWRNWQRSERECEEAQAHLAQASALHAELEAMLCEVRSWDEEPPAPRPTIQ